MNQTYEDDDGLLVRLLYRIWKRIGLDFIVQGALLSVFFSSIVYGLSTTVRGLEPGSLAQPVFAGAILGWFLSQSRLRAWFSWFILVVCGVILVLMSVGNLWAQTWLMLQAVNQHMAGSLSWHPAEIREVFPLIQSSVDFWFSLAALNLRIGSWWGNVFLRTADFDPLVTTMVWSMLLWILGVWGSWVLIRSGKPLLAVLPGGVLLTVSLAYTGSQINPLYGMLVSTLLLLAWNSFSRRQKHWEKSGIDYAEDLRLDVNVTAFSLTVGLVVLAALASMLSVSKIEEFLDRLRPEIVNPNPVLGESFGLEKPTAQPGERQSLTGISSEGLPRQHLLGSGAELSQQMVMEISTGEMPPMPVDPSSMIEVPRHYWHAMTFDLYTGKGWTTSPYQEVEYQARETILPGLIQYLNPDQPIPVMLKAWGSSDRVLRQQVTPVADLNQLVYASGDVIGVDKRYQIAWRLPPDAEAGLQGDRFAVLGKLKSYTVLSAETHPSEVDLRADEGEIPDWIKDHYLTLPASIPERVLDLAEQLTAGLDDPYDKALAIETYLREIPYSLELPVPPADRDVVDYFLFDLKTGYCDYYATAMAVLARASGIPSRLSIGYSSGNYYPELAIYRVSEANAHSWPELYFPGIGWVEFEPTASLPQIERPKGLQLADDQFPVPLVKEAEPLFPFNFNAPGLWFAGLLLVVGCVVAWLIGDTWRLKRLVPQQTIRILYARLLKRGSSLGVRVQTGDTPNEFTNRLINVYRRLVEGKPWEPAFDVLQRESLRLVGLYNRSIYSQKPDTENDRLNAVRIWQLLRWRLWLLRNSIRMRLNKRHSG